jgi:ankyrin repeat protein
MFENRLVPVPPESYQQHELHVDQPFDPDAHCTVLKLCKLGSVPLAELQQALESGEDWSARDQYGDTALTFCARTGKFEAFKIIYEFDKQHRPIVLSPEHSGSTECTAPLDLIVGDTLTRKLSPGLLLAAGGLSPRAIHLLTEHLDTLDVTPRAREMAARLFRSLAGVNELDVVSALLADGVILQPIKIPVIEACWAGDQTDILDYLIADKVDMNEADHEGKTALHALGKLAFANRHPQTDFTVAKKVLATEANVNARDNTGRVPLMLAASQGCGSLLQLYSDAGADWEAVDMDGKTVLDHLNIFVGDIKCRFDSVTEFRQAYARST